MRKILSYVALGFIVVLAGVIVALTFISKDYNINLNNPDRMKVYINNSASNISFIKNDADSEENAKIYSELLKKYNASYKQKIMSGLFQGILGDNAEIVKISGTSKTTALSGGTYLCFEYNEVQTLKLNGKVYQYERNDGNLEDPVEYKNVYIEVKDSSNMTNINIYVQELDSQGNSQDYFYYKFVVRASQADLYDYIEGLEN